MQTNIKGEMKECISGFLFGTAGSFSLTRAVGKIDEACRRVAIMVNLFIDEQLAEGKMRLCNSRLISLA